MNATVQSGVVRQFLVDLGFTEHDLVAELTVTAEGIDAVVVARDHVTGHPIVITDEHYLPTYGTQRRHIGIAE